MPPKRTIRDLRGTVKVGTGATQALPTLPTAPLASSAPTSPLNLSALAPGLAREELSKLQELTQGDPDLLLNALESIKSQGVEATLQHLSQGGSTRELLFNLPSMKKLQEKERFTLEIHQAKESGVIGVFTCPRCGGKETVYSQKQVRSADEPMTIFIRCVACGHNWKRN